MGTEDGASSSTMGDGAVVDPRAPRFGQAITAIVLAVGVLTQRPEFVYAVAVVLGVAVLSRWRFDLYAFLWQTGGARVFSGSSRREAAAPHRFAKLLGAVFTTVASLLFVGGFDLVGYAVAVAVVGLATLSAGFGYCVGCRLYREVSYAQSLGWV